MQTFAQHSRLFARLSSSCDRKVRKFTQLHKLAFSRTLGLVVDSSA